MYNRHGKPLPIVRTTVRTLSFSAVDQHFSQLFDIAKDHLPMLNFAIQHLATNKDGELQALIDPALSSLSKKLSGDGTQYIVELEIAILAIKKGEEWTIPIYMASEEEDLDYMKNLFIDQEKYLTFISLVTINIMKNILWAQSCFDDNDPSILNHPERLAYRDIVYKVQRVINQLTSENPLYGAHIDRVKPNFKLDIEKDLPDFYRLFTLRKKQSRPPSGLPTHVRKTHSIVIPLDSDIVECALLLVNAGEVLSFFAHLITTNIQERSVTALFDISKSSISIAKKTDDHIELSLNLAYIATHTPQGWKWAEETDNFETNDAGIKCLFNNFHWLMGMGHFTQQQKTTPDHLVFFIAFFTQNVALDKICMILWRDIPNAIEQLTQSKHLTHKQEPVTSDSIERNIATNELKREFKEKNEPKTTFKIGENVIVHGLTKAKKYNGQKCVIDSFNAEKERYLVKMPTGGFFLVKADNIRPLTDLSFSAYQHT
ncbi:MAG: hypothetical protein VXW87_03500 [Pseudomonadota bacterium]|nr:hypothetical protein [Pseudomonadota bacterium]